jgi:hypothetical protein
LVGRGRNTSYLWWHYRKKRSTCTNPPQDCAQRRPLDGRVRKRRSTVIQKSLLSVVQWESNQYEDHSKSSYIHLTVECPELTPDSDEDDAALCSPRARASRVRDHPKRLTGRGGQKPWRLGADAATLPPAHPGGSPLQTTVIGFLDPLLWRT